VRFPPQVNVLASTILIGCVVLMLAGLLVGERNRRAASRR